MIQIKYITLLYHRPNAIKRLALEVDILGMNKNRLDDLLGIKKLDSKNMSGSLASLAKQIEEVFADAEKIQLPSAYKKVKNIAFFGMGGSALGARAVKALFGRRLKLPLEIINDYQLPGFVNKDTLVIASSYSGGTEEIVAAMKGAISMKAKVLALTSGGEIKDVAKKNKLPALIFGVKNNPCGSPRMGLGYAVFGLIAILEKLGFIKFGAGEKKAVIRSALHYETEFGLKNPSERNFAKKLAVSVFDKNVFFLGAEHLSGSAHIAANQTNENAKTFSSYFLLPELNHHLLEGLLKPAANAKSTVFFFLDSGLYSEKIKRRLTITQKVFQRRGLPFVSYLFREKDPLLQAVEALVFSGYLSFYLAMLYEIDPTAIPIVDFLKAEIKK